MKKLAVFIFFILLLSLWGFGVIFPDAGYVLVVLGQKTVETSLWFVCFACVLIVFSWWVASRFVTASWSFAQRMTDFFIFGTTERASKRAASGIIDFLAGDWLLARKKLIRTATKVESPLVNYLTAARCSFELGDREDAFSILNNAQKRYPAFNLPIGLAQAKMEIMLGRFEQAKILLRGLQQKYPKNAPVLKSLCELYESQQDWVGLNDAVILAKKFKAASSVDIFAFESSVLVGQMQMTSDLARRTVASEKLVLLRKAWAKVSSLQQRVPRVIAAYASALMDHLLDHEAETILQKNIARAWDDQLVNLYGCLRVNNIDDVLKTAEEWLKYRPHNPILLRALGRLNLSQQAWHSARDYFQRSLSLQNNPETSAELARLLNAMGEKQKSLEVYQTALQVSYDALPDLPQPTKHR